MQALETTMEVDRPLARYVIGNLDVVHTAMLEIRSNNIISVDIAETRSVSLLIYCHWGRGPMETGVYMLGTLQALAESSSNVLTRYISFTFHM